MKSSVRYYLIGFLLSMILTLAAYIPVVIHQNSYHVIFSHQLLIPLVLLLAFAQMIVQMIFFLHLGREPRPRWNLIFFMSTASIILIIVIGSIWIMAHLNYNMTPNQMNTYIQNEEGLHK